MYLRPFFAPHRPDTSKAPLNGGLFFSPGTYLLARGSRTVVSKVCVMKGFLPSLAMVLAVTTNAAAQSSLPSTVRMSCGQAAGLVASRGAIVLGTGGYTYDRFVADRRFWLRSEITEPAWVPAGDTPQCLVGYRCVEADRFFDR